MSVVIRDGEGKYFQFELEDLVDYRLPREQCDAIISTGSERIIPPEISRDSVVVEDHNGNFYSIPQSVMGKHLIPEDRITEVLDKFRTKYLTKLRPGSMEELHYDCGPKWY